MKFFATKEDYLAFRAAWAKASQQGRLFASHHLMYNLIRGKNPERGFTPITKFTKLTNGHTVNGALVDAAWSLRMSIQDAQNGKEPYWLSMFDGTLTMEQLATLECPKIDKITPDFGRGKAVRDEIIKHKTLTWDRINEIMEAA